MLSSDRKKLEVIEVEHQKDLLKVVEDTEAELRQKDHHLAVVEARLCQLRIQIDKEKRLSPKGIPDDFPEEVSASHRRMQFHSKRPVLSCAFVQFV